MKKKNFWKKLSGCMRAFLIVAAAFLIVGLGTLGTVRSTGKSYELPVKQAADEKEPGIVLYVTPPEGITASNVSVREIYLNVGTVYAEIGTKATVRVARGTSSSSTFANYTDVTVTNGYEVVETASEEEDGAALTTKLWGGSLYNWIKVSDFNSTLSTNGYTLSTYSYWKLVSKTCNVVINEIVFVGVDRTLDEEEQTPLLLSAKVDASSILYDTKTGTVSGDAALKQASAVVDSQYIPTLSQSSFFRYGEEEAYSLMSVTEMRFGSSYYSGDVYNGDRVYNSLGTDLLALGTAIFGVSPFGLRFFPMMASFGILVLGFLFVRALFKSDKAGLIFAVLYALCGVSFSLGHLGTPLTIGLFFLVASLYTCYLFYAHGMKKARFSSALPPLLSGLFGAAAICVNGAYVVPMLGVVALFAAGMVRQIKEKHRVLGEAIAQAEEEERSVGEDGVSPGKQKVVDVLNEYHFKNTVAPAIFAAFLILGAVVLSMLGVLPVYFTYVKLFGDPASTSVNVLSLMWSAFTGGFTGVNAVSSSAGAWSFVYKLFVGSGEAYAVTAAGLLPAIVAVLAGVVGLVIAVIRLVSIFKSKDAAAKRELPAILILFGGLILSLITASFAGGSLAFMLAAYFFAFAFAAFPFAGSCGKHAKALRVVAYVWLAALVVFFALFAVFTFSVPLSATVIAKFFA